MFHRARTDSTRDFLTWVTAFYDYAARAGTGKPPLGELRRLHRHHLSVPQAYVTWHYHQPEPQVSPWRN